MVYCKYLDTDACINRYLSLNSLSPYIHKLIQKDSDWSPYISLTNWENLLEDQSNFP